MLKDKTQSSRCLTAELVKEAYGRIAKEGKGYGCGTCGTDTMEFAKTIGYTANLGLSCGNPAALANLKEGEVVLDLGSGAGFDCFLVKGHTQRP
jgi:cyclopropane fatty-acyl-phospholipid synthase-like methyltransferase